MNLETFFIDLHARQTHLYPLAAIWFTDNPIMTSRERKVRITEGDEVCIKDGQLIDCNELNKANYRVTGAQGTINSDELYLSLINLENDIKLTIKIK